MCHRELKKRCDGNPIKRSTATARNCRNGRQAASGDRHGDLSLKVDFCQEADPDHKVGGRQVGVQQRLRLRDALRLGEGGAR